MSDVGVVIEKARIDNNEVFDWNRIVERISTAFRFTADEKQRFANKKLAKLIAAIPFLAGCKDPLRVAREQSERATKSYNEN